MVSLKAATLECDDMILLTNTQSGDKSKILSIEFNLEGYELLTNSKNNNMKGVSIALRIATNIKIMDARMDNDEIMIALKLMVE